MAECCGGVDRLVKQRKTMTWKKGQSGNPHGRPPAGESFADTIRAKLTPERREKLAEKAIALAEAGDIRALVFIRDTLDGRPKQSLEHSGPEGKPILIRDSWDDDGAVQQR
jgi:Family of unknown function (DUF5681)